MAQYLVLAYYKPENVIEHCFDAVFATWVKSCFRNEFIHFRRGHRIDYLQIVPLKCVYLDSLIDSI